ncbi:MAG: polyprenyl synthetase family protein [Bryobacteraceae bacterium]
MSETLTAYTARYRPMIERRLGQLCPRSSLEGTAGLNEALRCAVSGAGKRIRPLLTMLAAGAVRVPPEEALDLACGIEFLHISSVILDDLPAMDDARVRHHRPALHILYGEATALLAALALYAEAFRIFSRYPGLVEEAVRAVGCDGMIGGQQADLLGVRPSLLAKTTSLIRFALSAGAIAARAPDAQTLALARFGVLVGEAYQICDDLVDELASESVAGKTVGQDRRHGRPGFAAGSGLPAACRRARQLVEAAVAALEQALPVCGEREALGDFARTILRRINDLVEKKHADADGSGPVAPPGGRKRGLLAADPGR